VTLLVNTIWTIITAIIVLYAGRFLTTHLRFLKNCNIPEAVSGGLACSILVGAFFLDIANATIIQFFLATPLFR
jgi:ESS family glutamate:Na+ symporter